MIFPLLSEDGVREKVIVVGVTSSLTTLGGSGGGGAEIQIFTSKNRLILADMSMKVLTIHYLGTWVEHNISASSKKLKSIYKQFCP